MNGLLTQKPGREPEIGQIKLFLIEARTSKAGKPWNKIRNATIDSGGTPYLIKSVKPTGFEDDHGNVSFNLDIEPAENGAPRTQAAPQRAGNGYSGDDRSNRIERQHSQSVAVAYATLKGMNDITSDQLVALIDWFHRDVSRMPAAPASKSEPAPEPDDAPEPDEEEKF